MTESSLSAEQLDTYRRAGHLTVPDLFSETVIKAVRSDIDEWSNQFLSQLDSQHAGWFLEHGTSDARVLRKLDNPVYERSVFRRLAAEPRLLAVVEQLIGPGLRVWFSQVFLKPPGGGGPKPVHQDNFYFGPSDPDGVVTVWVALDNATTENGCLSFADGSNTGPVYPHEAPEGEPFNLQVPPEIAARFDMTAAPVPSGGVSFHHGNTLHQSSANLSDRPRRAVAMHFVNRETVFESPALEYDETVIVKLTD
jgi:ectoine hydroxylase-related dioxygenase (phytanoyl-CoA dioxygenase family)